MATSDLLNELNKETFKADSDLEIKLSNIIIQQLDDAAGDVSGLAVKWYVGLLPFLLSEFWPLVLVTFPMDCYFSDIL